MKRFNRFGVSAALAVLLCWSLLASVEAEGIYDEFMASIPEKGPGIAVHSMTIGLRPKDLNDYLESRSFETVNAVSLSATSLVWSFSPHFHFGVLLGGGSTGFLGSIGPAHSIGEDQYDMEVELQASVFDLIAHYKGLMGQHWQYFVGGGLGVTGIRLTMETTPIAFGETRIERYTGRSGNLLFQGGIRYRINKLFGLFLDTGVYLCNIGEIERGNEEDRGIPDINMSGIYLGAGLSMHI